MSITVLVVEDEADIRDLVCLHLKHAGMNALACTSAEQARAVLVSNPVDMAIVDWMLPGESGISLVRQWRQDARLKTLPILMLTARGREGDKIEGFDAGADDYLVKPFSPRELIARVQALRRRSGHDAEPTVMQFRELLVDVAAQRVAVAGSSLELSPTEYRLLLTFLKNRDRVLTRAVILDKVWSNEMSIDERTVDVHVRRLRRALRAAVKPGYDEMIETVRGGGYRMAAENER
jgi:two-component system, OmpR family, phosphate regulon response regulator PhoB